MMQFSSQPTPFSSPIASSVPADEPGQEPQALNLLLGKDRNAHEVNDDVPRGRRSADASSAARSVPHYELITTASGGQTYRIRSTSAGGAGPNAYSELKFFLWDSALTPYNTSAWDVNNNITNGENHSLVMTHTLVLGEDHLTSFFKNYQKEHVPTNQSAISAPSSVKIGSAKGSAFSLYERVNFFVSGFVSTLTHGAASIGTVASTFGFGSSFVMRSQSRGNNEETERSGYDNGKSLGVETVLDCPFTLELTLDDQRKRGIIDTVSTLILYAHHLSRCDYLN